MNGTLPEIVAKLESLIGGDLLALGAPLFALAVSYLFFYEGLIYKVGGDNAFWRTVRSVLPYLDSAARDRGFYTSYQIEKEELVGTLDMDVHEAVELFYEKGYIDNPLASHKTDWKGRNEVASLGRYGYNGDKIKSWSKLKRFLMMSLIVQKQLHVTLFKREDGKVAVTAHYEDSPYCVLKAYKHLLVKDYDVRKGVEMVAEDLQGVGSFVLGE